MFTTCPKIIQLRGNVGENQSGAPTCQRNLCSYSGYQKYSWMVKVYENPKDGAVSHRLCRQVGAPLWFSPTLPLKMPTFKAARAWNIFSFCLLFMSKQVHKDSNNSSKGPTHWADHEFRAGCFSNLGSTVALRMLWVKSFSHFSINLMGFGNRNKQQYVGFLILSKDFLDGP